MQKQIKFVYAALIITIIGAVASLFLIRTINKEYFQSKNQQEEGIKQVYNNPWEGEWVRTDSTNFNQSLLEISNVTEESFDFSIEAFNGNMGSIGVDMEEGQNEPVRAVINGDTAKFVYEIEEEEPCIIIFSQTKEGFLEINESGCDYFKGNGVYFGGDYERGGSVMEITTESTNLFADKPEAYTEFAKLVGSSIDDFDITVGVEDEEYDEMLKADIGIFFMPHNAMTESIIMVGPGNKIWAAFSEWPDGAHEMVLQYFTNVPEYKNKIPTKIQEWNRNNYQIIYNK